MVKFYFAHSEQREQPFFAKKVTDLKILEGQGCHPTPMRAGKRRRSALLIYSCVRDVTSLNLKAAHSTGASLGLSENIGCFCRAVGDGRKGQCRPGF